LPRSPQATAAVERRFLPTRFGAPAEGTKKEHYRLVVWCQAMPGNAGTFCRCRKYMWEVPPDFVQGQRQRV
jgi:hypothetical protein